MVQEIFSPPATEQGMLGFFHTLERLKTNKRTGWVNQGIRLPESIADHMYRMSMMALSVPEEAGRSLDIAKCVMMSLVHDIAEADVGDITPEHASGISKQQKLELEEAAMERIKALLGHPSMASLRIISLWEEYEARETPEARFVKDLDLFELAVQAVEYENSNEIQTLQPFFRSTVPRIQHATVQTWARELMEQRRSLWAQRGWSNYIHVNPGGDESAIVAMKGCAQSNGNDKTELNNETEEPRARIPQKIYGQHETA